MAHLQYMPGDPRLVDQLVYELKSKGIFDQFRKDCIADVDTRPAYQNLRQRVENSVTTFLSQQCWKQDLNKNQLREKLRKHILDGNYLEQGVERIVDQVVNPKVASVFIPQVEELVYNYLGISRKKSTNTTELPNEKPATNLLPTDLEAVSPGSVKSNEDKTENVDMEAKEVQMDIDEECEERIDEKNSSFSEKDKLDIPDAATHIIFSGNVSTQDFDMSIDKSLIPLPDDTLENIPLPDKSPDNIDLDKLDLGKINLPETEEYAHLPENPKQIPLPLDDPIEKEQCFKPINSNSDDDESSSDSSLRRNMSPLTPIRNFNNENSCDAQQAFENDTDANNDNKKEPSTFRFTIDAKLPEKESEVPQIKNSDQEQVSLAYQFNNQVNINTYNTPLYDDSSDSNILHIDYESDANSKANVENKIPEADNSEDSKKGRKSNGKHSSHKSSHRSRDSHRHSSSKDKKSESKYSSSRDSSRHGNKSKEDHGKSKSSHKESDRPKDKSDKKDRDTSKHRSSHRSSSSHKDSKFHRSSSSSQKTSSKQSEDKKSSYNREKNEKSSDKSKDKKHSKHASHDSKSSSHHSEKDKKSSSKSKHGDKDKKKDKKDPDDHYSLSGRGNPNRRSTDRDSNDGSSSSKSSQNRASSKSAESKKEGKESGSKSETTSRSDATSPSDKEHKNRHSENNATNVSTIKPIIRVETQLEVPIVSPPRLPFVPDITLKKPKFAANLEEAKKMMKMRKFLDEEQKRMNQEAALLLEFQANVRPSLSQAFSNIPGPELEFACVNNLTQTAVDNKLTFEIMQVDNVDDHNMESQDQIQDTIIEDNPSEAGPASNINDAIEGACLNNKNIDTTVSRTEIAEIAVENPEDEKETYEADSDVNNDEKELQTNKKETYEENKPFSQLVEEITEYSKASERLKLTEKPVVADELESKNMSNMFEVTIITEELSETEDTEDNSIETRIRKEAFIDCSEEEFLHYFAEHEKYEAELKRVTSSNFFKKFSETATLSNKMYLVNCDSYEENLFKEVAQSFGQYDVYNYYKNGHLKLPNAKNVKSLELQTEVVLPVDKDFYTPKTMVFSPVKSECSFDLSSDYDAKLQEMVSRTSKQEVLEIILGGILDDASNSMPKIDYCTESNIITASPLKRKCDDVESSVNNNKHDVLTPNKIRKLSESDIISSTTEETEETSNNNKAPVTTRSKYLGKTKRVGLSKPKKTEQPNSPSSDKSVENYEQGSTQTPNGKLKKSLRSKVQRYDTADLYKPKLHYLSRRNNIS